MTTMSTCRVSSTVLLSCRKIEKLTSLLALTVLSTMLKRRFSHLLACAPVIVDSGLKAIQLMRQSIFDLMLMDIQMPFLDGVECTRRIRAGKEGILPANRTVHIVAVTSAVGTEPGLLYKSVGMDGMIAKPVRFDHLNEFIRPLAELAELAKIGHTSSFSEELNVAQRGHRLSTVSISSPITLEDGATSSDRMFEVLPPLPPAPTRSSGSKPPAGTCRRSTATTPKRSTPQSPRPRNPSSRR